MRGREERREKWRGTEKGRNDKIREEEKRERRGGGRRESREGEEKARK